MPSIMSPIPALPPTPKLADHSAMREFGDAAATRTAIYDSVLKAAGEIQPASNKFYSLSVEEPHWEDKEGYSLAEQKKAILEGRTLARRLRGTWHLKDAAGQTVEKKLATLAQVPYMTHRGTFILGGNEYTLAHQMRLRAGVFTRRKENGEIEAHANVLPGKGMSHHYFLEPETGVFKLKLRQSSVPLLPVMRAMGVHPEEMIGAWGPALYAANAAKDDPRAIDKVYERLVGRRGAADATREEKAQAVAQALSAMELDPEVTARTLGKPHDHLSRDALLATTAKLLAVSRGEADVDDRDHLAFQQFLGPEDLFAERMGRDRTLINQLLWKATNRKGLHGIPPNAFTRHVHAAILDSGLGQPLEEINPADVLDQQTRVSRLGYGGIPSLDAVPDEARNVQPSHVGYIDLVKTPESFSVGIDSRVAYAARKGNDRRLYTPFVDRGGQTVWKSPQDVADLAVGFPDIRWRKRGLAPAIVKGRTRVIPLNKVDLWLPHMEQSFSPLSNLVPLKTMTKGQRVSMGSRFIAQALPLDQAEAPLVRGQVPGRPGTSFEEYYGHFMGAAFAKNQPGRVAAVTPDGVTVKYADGSTEEHQIYHHFPYNRKTYLHSTPVVQPGDPVSPGQLLAKSNYTDDRGHFAVGKNLRVAYIPFRGSNYEDAYVISASAAKKLASEHMYQHSLEWDERHRRGKQAYASIFPGAYDKKTLDKMDDEGIVREGEIVHAGEPLILAAHERELSHKQVHSAHKGTFADRSLTWDHHSDGVVTDVAKTPKGVTVAVKALAPMQVGDKMCYDPLTEILTDGGWRPVMDITTSDRVATLIAGELRYLNPVATHQFHHVGKMYLLETTQVDLLVTDNHNLYARPRGGDYGLHEARSLYGKRYRLKRDAVWNGSSPDFVDLPGTTVAAGRHGNGSREIKPLRVRATTYAMLLGMFLSEGNLVDQPESGSYGFDLTQVKGPNREKMLEALREAGVRFSEHGGGTKVRIYGLHWLLHFRQFGHAADKFIPAEVFGWGRDLLSVLYRWLMWGDGAEGGTTHVYTTTSRRLADDVQRLMLHLGMSANVRVTAERDGRIKGKPYRFSRRYDVFVYRTKNRPTINHGHASQQGGQREEWVEYAGEVYCVTMPVGNVIYVRRNGKPVWCGNSGRYGDKGVVSLIVPDADMPHDQEGQPYEVLANPLGVISRTNPSQAVEARLGKLAAHMGRPYVVEDFPHDGRDMTEWAIGELQKHNVEDTETVTDPVTGRQIPGILTGQRYFMKLHHTSESKGQGRGLGAYTAENMPAKGGEEGSKRLALMDVNALLSHGATEVLRDAKLIRGQKNQEYWAAFMAGNRPPTPKPPFVYTKFLHQLQAAGVNVTREGPRLHIMALRDKDVDRLAEGRELQNAETVDWKSGLQPKKGGLFDVHLTGGHGGTRWAQITLAEPLPNPVMEEPIRHLLGLTGKRFENILAGKEEFSGHTGPAALLAGLDHIDVDQALAQARADVASGRRSGRNDAVRKLKALAAAKEKGVHPREWFLKKVPVLPPTFRPVSVMQGSGGQLISDANYLYKELFDANQALHAVRQVSDDVADERQNLYGSFKAVTGLGDPVQPKNQERKVKGMLQQIFGYSPKFGTVQQKLLGTTVDLVGRAVVTPNPDLDMDQIGLPENRAWEVYTPFVARRLVRHGVPRLQALQYVKDRSPLARKALLEELEERPVLVNRAPVLHRYGLMAFWPRLTKGDVLQVSPIVVGGFGMDFDGDASNYHVPASDESKDEAVAKMLPSHNLFSVSGFKVHYLPRQEYVGGLWAATAKANKERRPRVFSTAREALEAFHQGDLDPDQRIEVLDTDRA